MEKIAIFFNPGSGRGRAAGKRPLLEKALRRYGIGYELFVSRDEADLRRLIRSAGPRFRILTAAGGDSTLLILVNEMLKNGLDGSLGLIGLGSCNDLARELGIESLEKACHALRSQRRRWLDVGTVNRDRGGVIHYFPGQASLGLGVWINQTIEELIGEHPLLKRFQTLSGVLAGRRLARRGRIALPLTIEWEGGKTDGDFSLALFSNIRFYASGRMAVPTARIDDGLLDALLISASPFGRLLRLSRLAVSGRHVKRPEVRLVQSPCFQVRAEQDFVIQVDGEMLAKYVGPEPFRQVTMACLPRALPVIC